MKLLAMNIIEHPDLAADEAWIVFDENATQVPAFNIIRTRKGLWFNLSKQACRIQFNQADANAFAPRNFVRRLRERRGV